MVYKIINSNTSKDLTKKLIDIYESLNVFSFEVEILMIKVMPDNAKMLIQDLYAAAAYQDSIPDYKIIYKAKGKICYDNVEFRKINVKNRLLQMAEVLKYKYEGIK